MSDLATTLLGSALTGVVTGVALWFTIRHEKRQRRLDQLDELVPDLIRAADELRLRVRRQEISTSAELDDDPAMRALRHRIDLVAARSRAIDERLHYFVVHLRGRLRIDPTQTPDLIEPMGALFALSLGLREWLDKPEDFDAEHFAAV